MKSKVICIILLSLSVFIAAQVPTTYAPTSLVSVNVTGFVDSPGTYQLSSISRLSDALKLAGTPSPIILEKGPTYIPRLYSSEGKSVSPKDSLFLNFQALRSVKLTRGKETKTYDYMKFVRMGDLEQNPILRDGDVINVGAVHTTVTIVGEVYYPGEYEYIAGDRLSDLLNLAQGFTLSAERKIVNIYRYKENLKDFDLITVDLRIHKPEDIIIYPYDRITINRDTEYRRGWNIIVEGNVKSPGKYYIGDNTTLYDILLLCGGPNSRGDLRNAIYANLPNTEKVDPEFERLKKMDITQMSIIEYHYLQNRLRQFPGRYSIDVSRTWESKGSECNPVLQDGDYLYVPLKMDMVAVTGQVVNPGLIPWVEGKTWDYYVKSAGGYTNNKSFNGVRIIDAQSGNWVRPSSKTVLYPGDTVFVAAKTEYDAWTRFKDIMLITTQIMTIILGIHTLAN